MIEFILGLGVLLAILLYITWSLDKTHVFFKLLVTFFALHILMLVPSSMLTTEYCSNEITSSLISGNTTTNTYSLVCDEVENSSALTFYKSYMYLLRAFWMYLLVYITYVVLDYFGKVAYIKGRFNIKSVKK